MSKTLLNYREDRRTIGFVLVAHALQIGGFFLWPQMTWWMAFAWIATACWFSWLTAVITHNTIHAPIFRSRRLNKVFQHVLTLGYGHPVSAFVPGHNLSHHMHAQTRKDVMRTTKSRFRWNLLNVVLAPLVVSGDIMRSDLAFAVAMRKERPRWFRQWVAEYVVFILVQLVFLFISPVAYFLFLFIPHGAAAGGIVGINFLQHDGCDNESEWNHSRNFVGPILNWFAFNNGFHTIHHMHAGLHWSKAPEAHAKEVAPFIHTNLEQPSLPVYFWKAYFWPGVRIDYKGNPYEPPEEGPDESWIPKRDAVLPADLSFGAES